MDEDNNIDRREEMLSQFRESLSHPISERYFDEDQLLDIFDYAGDMGDDYIRMEVLLCAARFYPDSEELLERKAIFYNQYSGDTIQRYLEDNPGLTGLMWDILKLRQDIPDTMEDRCLILDEIIAKYDSFNDEEVVQFVELVSAYGAVQWIKDNMDKLSAKVNYINMLLYEIAVMAENINDKDLSISMLERLTELEPYNQYYWFFLAKQYGANNDLDNALNAVDYALAISPSDTNALIFKAKLIYRMERPLDETERLLKSAIDVEPSNTEAVKLLAALYRENEKDTDALNLLQGHLDTYPTSAVEIIPELILLHPDNIDGLLDRFFAANPDNTQILWISWAHHLTQNDAPDLAAAVIDAYERNSGEVIRAVFTIENLFKEQRFVEALEALNDFLENNESGPEVNTIVYIQILSMIRLGEYTKALTFCLFIENNLNIDRLPDISDRLQYVGLLGIVKQIRMRLASTTDPADWQDYDPLCIWDNKDTED